MSDACPGSPAHHAAAAATAEAATAAVSDSAPAASDAALPTVSVIIPMRNAAAFIDDCLRSVVEQTYRGPIEVCIFDDRSTDDSAERALAWQQPLRDRGATLVLKRSASELALGDGHGRNEAVAMSTGQFLCFQDADDIMLPTRIEKQLQCARERPDAIVGSGFNRIPEGSTWHYAQWCNSITERQLYLHQFRELTIIQPTWFMARAVFERVGGYSEHAPGAQEPLPCDLMFFHRHLDLHGTLFRVPEPLVVYRCSPGSISTRIPRRSLLRFRLRAFERRVLEHWETFMIWGAGRDGRNFYHDLEPEYQSKVTAFCDVDVKKLGTYFSPVTRKRLPVRHVEEVRPPFVVCVAMGRTAGEMERRVQEQGLVEGVDYWHFN